MDTARFRYKGLPIAILAVTIGACIAAGCGDNDNGHGTATPTPSFLSTPVASHCGDGGDFCGEGNQCCGTHCTVPNFPCCQVPEGLPDAGSLFSCRSNQKCCSSGCVQIGSPCT